MDTYEALLAALIIRICTIDNYWDLWGVLEQKSSLVNQALDVKSFLSSSWHDLSEPNVICCYPEIKLCLYV